MRIDSNELVSVITPAYNASEFIERTIESVLCQSYVHWEHLIVDDCSNDSTVELVEGYSSKDPRIKLHRLPINSGAAVSRNKAMTHAKGRYLAFLDADDLWAPSKLEEHLAFVERTGAHISFTQYDIINHLSIASGKVIDRGSPARVTYTDMLKKSATMGCSTVLIDTAKISQLQMPNIRTGQDYALWLRILRNGEIAEKLPSTLSSYRITPGSISRNKVRKARRQWEIYRRLENIGILKSAYYFCFYAYRAVNRR